MKKGPKMKIILLDSLQFFVGESLYSVLNSFNCNTKKSSFPHDFVTKNRLNYIGSIPVISYFNNNITEYNKFISELTNSNVNN